MITYHETPDGDVLVERRPPVRIAGQREIELESENVGLRLQLREVARREVDLKGECVGLRADLLNLANAAREALAALEDGGKFSATDAKAILRRALGEERA